MTTKQQMGPLGAVALLRGHAPYTLAGYAGFRAVIDIDGAVPARLKALFASVAAIDRRYPDLARRGLARGAGPGPGRRTHEIPQLAGDAAVHER